MGCSSWGHKELDRTERPTLSHTHTHTHIYIYMSTYIPFLLDLPPTYSSRSSQNTEMSSLCCSFPLAIYFTNGNLQCH